MYVFVCGKREWAEINFLFRIGHHMCWVLIKFQEGPVLGINTASNLFTGYFSRSRFGNTPGIDRSSEGYLSMEQREKLRLRCYGGNPANESVHAGTIRLKLQVMLQRISNGFQIRIMKSRRIPKTIYESPFL